MLKNPSVKYRPFAPIALSDRTWPNRTITHPPVWLSTDLRDGNQALIEPMNVQRKLRMFELLVRMGFKEIEVAFPSASQTDFDFVRSLIEQQLIPDDVTIQVLTQARDSLIRRTFESLQGAKRAIVHVYNATSPVFRRTVFNLDRPGTLNLAVKAAQLMRELASDRPETEWFFEYSPETFTATELDFAKEICDAVLDVWEPTPEHKAIINLPATVEVATPNLFADQVEWMHRHLARRDSVVLSVHPHNDRGCAIAAAELAQMAGADRVEGCLFAHGERTGNVDLVTLALNLYTQGIHPGLDFSEIDEIARTVEDCTQLPIHPRHPYVGDLVYTAFSGSHQDAIKKGFAVQQPDAPWEVPYLPLDPADVGRTYESVVRVNSQSGKGGIAFLLERDYRITLPRRLQIEFSQVVQQVMDTTGKELAASDLWQLFEREYLQAVTPLKYIDHHLSEVGDKQAIALTLQAGDKTLSVEGTGNGPIDASIHALNLGIRVRHYEEHSLSQGSDAYAIAYIELAIDSLPSSLHGVGIHPNTVTASLLAVLSAVNRLWQTADSQTQTRLIPRGV
ncbi:2-isopropylmalate synthase [Kamptonema cortianum]|uniref:2-isopropylmalate synthase n=1 Tax=Geitlerinema calcuttense NRMC-F 0142 TaxID=2922238 RepID=A0ABT7LYV4_9CYAN|nr:2-isopropylmalate synthase [Geitlerinema calcuttense]MDI9635892.1 2-isopropylmalate synthase [Geitlerinema splendidum]MDK3155175.1 2-isopropylmalate synthase [Kamptonema cortianum]MDL5048326.1 2-isopropylmalate synthase [Oscillatoria amoena NRMC-F 0135]MDL5057191.1 2-isopropylmalate synthase [Geitlerinema calcuttense NRMC-F 0142]